MAVDLSYGKVLEALKPYRAEKRTESASFLIWYLVNYYHLDELEAIDCVCDQPGDKGVDGIYVNEDAGTIDVFQSKLSQKVTSTVGDTVLKEFSGTLAQFATAASIAKLAKTAANTRLAQLIESLELKKKIDGYQLRGVFVANVDLHKDGAAFLENAPQITFVGRSEMEKTYVSDKKEPVQAGIASFDVFGLAITEYAVDANTTATIAPVLASDLVKLQGIQDQSLFSLNVRASLGSTKVNKDIAESIRRPELHKSFPLFHNGITVLAKQVSHDQKSIKIHDYYVVNGCQSLNTLYANRKHISGDLRILTKFIQVDAGSQLAELITSNSNNQNGVKPRDFKSNHPIQTRLQNEFHAHYAGQFAFEVKRGEPLGGGTAVSNEEAGLYLVAFDLKEPWTTHRKYQVFDDRYTEIFGRPLVTADRIVMLHRIATALEKHLPELKNELIGRYLLTKYAMLYAIRMIFEQDDTGKAIIESPAEFVRDQRARVRFDMLLDEVAAALVIDLDVETQHLGEDFDYRGKLRDREYVADLVNKLVATYRKDVLRKKAPTIAETWAATAE